MFHRLVADKVILDLVNQPFNPPLLDVEFSRIDFELEFQEVYEALVSVCRARGFNEEDCVVWGQPPSPPSRLIQVAIESEQAWDVTLVPSLHGLVADRTPEYAIWLFHEVLSMELCDVFIRKEEVLGRGNVEVLAGAGFVI